MGPNPSVKFAPLGRAASGAPLTLNVSRHLAVDSVIQVLRHAAAHDVRAFYAHQRRQRKYVWVVRPHPTAQPSVSGCVLLQLFNLPIVCWHRLTLHSRRGRIAAFTHR